MWVQCATVWVNKCRTGSGAERPPSRTGSEAQRSDRVHVEYNSWCGQFRSPLHTLRRYLLREHADHLARRIEHPCIQFSFSNPRSSDGAAPPTDLYHLLLRQLDQCTSADCCEHNCKDSNFVGRKHEYR